MRAVTTHGGPWLRRMPDALVRPRASRAPLLAQLLVRHRPRRRRNAPPGLRSVTDSVRPARLARDVYTTGMEHSPTSATARVPTRGTRYSRRRGEGVEEGWGDQAMMFDPTAGQAL